VAGWSLRSALVLLAALAGPGAAWAEPLPVVEVAPGTYLHRGLHEEATAANLGAIANIGFVVGEAAVAVIDSGGSAAQGRRLRQAIRRVTDLPIRYVINTHVHPDHILGNAAFLADRPTFVGHVKLPRAMAARGPYYLDRLQETLGAAAEGTELVPPALLVDGRLELDLGGRALLLVGHPTAHTDNDLAVHDPRSGALWLGDLLFTERTPVVDGSLKGWLRVLAQLRGTEVRLAIPGHGPESGDWPAALEPQERYLRTLLTEIRAVIAAGRTIEEAVAGVGWSERDSWLLFEDYHPRNVLTSFTELEWE
jgi:quinoprotein relay system zinc metallohydrolase 2